MGNIILLFIIYYLLLHYLYTTATKDRDSDIQNIRYPKDRTTSPGLSTFQRFPGLKSIRFAWEKIIGEKGCRKKRESGLFFVLTHYHVRDFYRHERAMCLIIIITIVN